MTYTVNAAGLCKAFGGHTVLDHVDLAVEPGHVLGLLGPNGAGKTTLVRILATLLRPDAGTVTIAGHDLLADPVAVKRAISLTGQFAAIDEVLTGRENLRMMAQLRRVSPGALDATVRELLDRFELTDAADRRTGTYSGGMKRRLDLAISVITRPAVLFLDEPTTGLDPRSREQLWGSVRRLAADGVTVLLTTQYLEEADQLADTVALLDRGRIVARGTADELKSQLGSEVVQLRFDDVATLRRAAQLLRVGRPATAGAVAQAPTARVDERLRTVEMVTDGSAAAVAAALHRLSAHGACAAKVAVHRPSLDDVFLALTGATRADRPHPELEPSS